MRRFLFPTAVFLAVMVVVLSLVQYDYPAGIERIEPRAEIHEEP